MKLHLGVVDFPYSFFGGKTTGDVAEILEKKYHIMATFFALHAPAIAALLEESVAGGLENLLMGGGGVTINTLGAESAIELMFRLWLAAGGMNGLAPGVPTRAAMRGVNHRFKRPYARRGPRVSFIDTGTFIGAFKAWTEGFDFTPGGGGSGNAGAAAATLAEDVEAL